MRNLKRALSLALASIMVLGLMVVGASAASFNDFTDKDEIKNTEAVNTMVSLGVISGKDDGSYDPAGSLTRAEACTLIARMLGGGKDPILGSNIKSNFKDTQGHWAETYIAYCANLGIIAGVGNGYFKPDDTLTGSAAAKMVLCALGYKPEFEGIGGANWELATNTLATKIKLYDGLEDLNPSATISRDDVAQLIFNGVQADEVEYRNLQGDYSGTLYAQPVNGTGNDSSMLHERFNVYKATGVVVANEHYALDGTALKAGKTEIVVKDNNTDKNAGVYNVTTTPDMIGQRVVLYVSYGSSLNPNPASDVVLGNAIVAESNHVVNTSAEVKADDWSKFLKDNGLTSGGAAYVNYSSTNASIPTSNPVGRELTIIDNNNDGRVDYWLMLNESFGRVTTYNTTKETFKAAGMSDNVDFSDVVGVEDVALNDYVLWYQASGLTYVTKAEIVSNVALESYVANKSATIGGTKYVQSGITGDINVGTLTAFVENKNTTTTNKTGGIQFNNAYDLYLDRAGNLVAFTVSEEGAKDYALVMETGVQSGAALTGDPVGEVKLLLADGTTVSGKIDMDATLTNYQNRTTYADDKTVKDFANDYVTKTGEDKDEPSKLMGTIVTYSKNDNGYALTPTNYDGNITAVPGTASTALKKNAASMTIDSKTLVLNDSTVFFFQWVDGSTTKTAVITGTANLSNRNDGTGIPAANIETVAYNTTTKVASAVYISVDPQTSTSSYAYVKKNPSSSIVDGTLYNFYTAVLEDGTKTEFKAAGSTNIAGDTVYKFTTGADGVTKFTNLNLDADGALLETEKIEGYVSDVQGSTFAVTNKDGVTVYYALGNAVAYDISDVDDIKTTDVMKNQKVSITVKKDGSNVLVGSIFVTEQDATTRTVTINGVSEDVIPGTVVTVNQPAGSNGMSIVSEGKYLKSGSTSGSPYNFATSSNTESSVQKLTATAYFVMPDADVVVKGEYDITDRADAVVGDTTDTWAANAGSATAYYGDTVTVTVTKTGTTDGATTVTVKANDINCGEVVSTANSTTVTPATVTFTMPAADVTLTLSK